MTNEIRRSVSALKQFEFCERQFYYRRILKLPEPPSVNLALGILYHSALEIMAKNGAFGKESVVSLLEEAKVTPMWKDPGLTDEELIEEIWANLGRVIRDVLPHLKIEKVEAWGTRFCAKVDVVSATTPVVENGRIIDTLPERCIVDWKTVSKLRQRSQYEVDQSMQLALYCLEFGAMNGAIVEIPRNLKQDLNVIVTRFDDYDLRRWNSFFEAQFAAMNSRSADEAEYKLAVRGHGLCSPKWCPYWNRCPGGK